MSLDSGGDSSGCLFNPGGDSPGMEVIPPMLWFLDPRGDSSGCLANPGGDSPWFRGDSSDFCSSWILEVTPLGVS